MTNPVLILLTSHAQLGDSGEATGFHWEELTTPYWVLRDGGHDVRIASVKGGMPPADPGSDSDEDRPASVQRFMDDADAMAALRDSLPIDKVKADDYAAIYLPGGHGTMWDLAQTPAVGETIARAYEQGAAIGAVCHGPAGLVGATLSDGTPLVQGKQVNSFTDAEEAAVGKDKIVPYLLESRLRDLGAAFEGNREPFGPHAVRDGRLVTGQNPQSAERVAGLLIEAIKDAADQRAA